MRLERRAEHIKGQALVKGTTAAGFALLLTSLVFASYGADPLKAWAVMVQGAAGSTYGLSEVVVKSIPLLFCGLAVAVPATMLLWNIGAEGQYAFGTIGAAWVGLSLPPDFPPWLGIPAAMLAGAALGGLWALAPGVLKAYWRVSEILTTLLLNYVALIFLDFLYFGPWRDPQGMGFPGTPQFSEAVLLPRLPGTRIHLGILLGLALAVGLHLLLNRSRLGYGIRVMGQAPAAARYAGMNVARNTVAVMAIAGAMAGLAGMSEATGIHWRLLEGINAGYGYDGIIVACLAGFRPLWTPAAALLLGALFVGGEQLQAVLQLPSSIRLVLEAALLLGLLAGEGLSGYRLRPGKAREQARGGDDAR